MTLRSIFLGGAVAFAALPAAADDIINMVTSYQIRSMDPVSQGFWMQEFGQGELLMKFQPDSTITPWLAESLERIDDTTWMLTIRDGITFQNGNPMDVAAVLAAIAYHRERNTGTQSVLPAEATFTQTGEREITIDTSVPLPDLPSIMAHESRLMIIDVETVLSVGEDYEQLEGAGIHTGPYRLVSLDEQRLVAERFDDYWQGTPAMAGVELRFVADPSARILAVQNGEADIALYPPIAATPVYEATPNLNLALGPVSMQGFLGFMNVADGALSETALRRAVMLAVNSDELANDVFHGSMNPARGFYSPVLPWTVENYSYDPVRANAILDEAGWVRDGDSRSRSRDGEELSITILIHPRQPDLEPMSTALQAYLREIGVDSQIVSVDSLNDAMAEGVVEWDLALNAVSTTVVGSMNSFLNNYLACGGERNFGNYCNATIDSLIGDVETTMDPEARAEIMQEIQRILVEEDPYVFAMTYLFERALVSDDWSNYEPGVAWNHIKWDTAPNP